MQADTYTREGKVVELAEDIRELAAAGEFSTVKLAALLGVGLGKYADEHGCVVVQVDRRFPVTP